MPNRSSKPKLPRDLNQRAHATVAYLTRDRDAEPAPEAEPQPDPETGKLPDGRDAAAVSLGRRGGLKGGKARAEKLSARKRSEIAKKAAQTRWKKRKPPQTS